MAPSVIDANCMHYFQKERLDGAAGKYSLMINVAFGKGFIAIDSDGRAQHEYSECCRPSAVGLNLSDWISDQLAAGRICLVDLDPCLNKKLRMLGVPSKDHKWAAIAKGASADVIVSEDIDLYSPTAKCADSKARLSILEKGGPVSRFLDKTHGIAVLTAEKFVDCWG